MDREPSEDYQGSEGYDDGDEAAISASNRVKGEDNVEGTAHQQQQTSPVASVSLIGSIVGIQQRLDLHHEHTDAPPLEGVELVAQQEEEGVREEESGGEERVTTASTRCLDCK